MFLASAAMQRARGWRQLARIGRELEVGVGQEVVAHKREGDDVLTQPATHASLVTLGGDLVNVIAVEIVADDDTVALLCVANAVAIVVVLQGERERDVSLVDVDIGEGGVEPGTNLRRCKGNQAAIDELFDQGHVIDLGHKVRQTRGAAGRWLAARFRIE